MVTDAGDDFIFTTKETSHRALYDFINGSELARHEEKVRRRATKETFRCRWIEAVPIREAKDAILVNWIGFEIVDVGSDRNVNLSGSVLGLTPRLSGDEARDAFESEAQDILSGA